MTIIKERIYPAALLQTAVLEAMARLGPTVDDVADNLWEQGYNGHPCQSQHCPMANYLREAVRTLTGVAYDVAVAASEISALAPIEYWRTMPTITVPTTPTIATFVDGFDNGNWSSLQAGTDAPDYDPDVYPDLSITLETT